MSKVKNLVLDIEDDLLEEVLFFDQIAEKHNVTIEMVNMIWDDICERAREWEVLD